MILFLFIQQKTISLNKSIRSDTSQWDWGVNGHTTFQLMIAKNQYHIQTEEDLMVSKTPHEVLVIITELQRAEKSIFEKRSISSTS